MKTIEWIDSQVKVIDGYISDFNSKIEAAEGQASAWKEEVKELLGQRKGLLKDKESINAIKN